MKILMLGGTGTISRYIVRQLAEQGHALTVLNHHHHAFDGLPNVQSVLCDRRDFPAFVRMCRELGPFDCVYDMITFTPEEAQSSIEAFRGNTAQLVFCSTVDVYSKNGAHYPVREMDETRPRDTFPYAYQKRICEEMLLEAHDRGDFQLTILRPAHIYSEETEKSKLLFHSFQTTPGASYHLDRIRKGKPIILHGDGMSIWNVTHGSDAARAFVGALNNPAAYGKAYTVCADECMSFREYYTAVQQEMKAPPIRFVFIPMDLLVRLEPERAWLGSQNFMFNNVFDNSAAKRDLGMKQTVSWREGIRRCLAVYDQRGYEDSDLSEYAFYDRIIENYERMCDEMVQNHIR